MTNLTGAHRHRLCRAASAVALGLFFSTSLLGCGTNEPAIAKGNVKLIGKLKTAIGAKKIDWLNATAKQIDEAHQQGKLSEPEYAALKPIVAAAHQNQWDDANTLLTRLIDAQHGP